MLSKANGNEVIDKFEKSKRVDEAAKYYGLFLESLGFDYMTDPQTIDTPKRVAKAWLDDLIRGSITNEPDITVFPNEENYNGVVIQTGIKVNSMCAHHNLPFYGYAAVAYIPKDNVIGLSKLNRIVDFYSRRPNIQESLTKQIHDHIDRLCIGNRGVAVVVESQHNCVRCRGIKQDSVMKTSQMSGYFWTNEVGTRAEFFNLIDQSRY